MKAPAVTPAIRLPESVRARVRALAEREGVSINQLIATAVAEKLSALDTEEYLERRAKRGSRARFRRALRAVPDVPPDDADRL